MEWIKYETDFKKLRGRARVEAMLYLKNTGVPLVQIAGIFGISKQLASVTIKRWLKRSLNMPVGSSR